MGSYRWKMMGLHCPWAPNNALWRHLPNAILSMPIPALDRQTESVGQTVLWHSPYGKAGPPLTDMMGHDVICHMLSRSFWMCSLYNRKEVMTAHRSWSTCQAKGKCRTISGIGARPASTWWQYTHPCNKATKKGSHCFSGCLPFDAEFGPPSAFQQFEKTCWTQTNFYHVFEDLPPAARLPRGADISSRAGGVGERLSPGPGMCHKLSICWELGAVTEDGAARFKTLMRFNIRDHCNNECLC